MNQFRCGTYFAGFAGPADHRGSTVDGILDSIDFTACRGVVWTVSWNDEFYELRVNKKNLAAILRGEAFSRQGEPYTYEGITYETRWDFRKAANRLTLQVSYFLRGDCHSEGVGWEGFLSEAEIPKPWWCSNQSRKP